MSATMVAMERQDITARDVGNGAFDLVEAIGKWLLKVVTIAVGTCLGLLLFAYIVVNWLGYALRDVEFPDLQFPRSTTTTTTPTTQPPWEFGR